ncbi:hypothetical protein E1267_36045 [Nonomuraea longispora]|uniref:DUF4115 domain-containing protein n=1 Tax=Nonomuraea longispora TaxID=1848320 RepID=A0A4R4MUV6_9ACTN|nr:hypothetical protein [Nonomuraea longispora]TDB99948.1 hypothetical protein E1267_36045 [Nonomuraea longispora]
MARSALTVLAAGAVLTLLVIGGRALLLAPGGQAPERERASAPATGLATAPASDATARVPTLRLLCEAETCPTVTVRVPGGDVLYHHEMTKGEELNYFEPELDVVLSDAGTVRVTENGKPREQGDAGKREAFTVREPG